MSEHAIADAAGAPAGLSAQTWRIVCVLACPVFMVNLDASAIATALPTIAQDLGCEARQMGVVMTALLVVVAICVPASGWLANRFGARNVLRVATVIFVGGALLCGRANSLPVLAMARAVQGVGAALMVPVARTLLTQCAKRHELAAAMGWQAPPALAAIVLGPLLGGFVVTHLGWRWVFDIHLPAGVATVLLATHYLPVMPRAEPEPLDLRGLALVGLALAGLMVGLETAGQGAVPVVLAGGAIVVGGLAAAAYGWHLRRAHRPILDIRLVRLPCFGRLLMATFLYRAGNGAMPFLLPMILQLGLGWSPMQAGLVVFAGALVALPLGPLQAPVLRRFGCRPTIAVVAVLSGSLFALCALIDPTWPTAAVCAVLILRDVLLGVQLTALNTLAYDDVPAERLADATALAYATARVAQAGGIAMAVMALDLADIALGYGPPGRMALWAPLLLVGGLAMAAAPMALRLPVGAGDELTGRKAAPRG